MRMILPAVALTATIIITGPAWAQRPTIDRNTLKGRCVEKSVCRTECPQKSMPYVTVCRACGKVVSRTQQSNICLN
jgi:hypothetical protein